MYTVAKSWNLLIGKAYEEIAKLADFGVSEILDSGSLSKANQFGSECKNCHYSKGYWKILDSLSSEHGIGNCTRTS